MSGRKRDQNLSRSRHRPGYAARSWITCSATRSPAAAIWSSHGHRDVPTLAASLLHHLIADAQSAGDNTTRSSNSPRAIRDASMRSEPPQADLQQRRKARNIAVPGNFRRGIFLRVGVISRSGAWAP
jgi:hypothetical protein